MKKLGMFLTLMLALTMVCHRVFAQSVTITLMPGWNWISVPLMDTLDFETAMGTFTPVSGDIIKSRWGQSFYNGNRWMGSLSQFFPGYGYMYKSNRTMPVMVTFNAQQPVPQVVVTTSEPMLITGNSAMSGGNVTSSNGDYVSLIVRGICWSTHQDPTLNDNFIEVGNSMGNFTAPMTGLNISTTYYVRAYAVTPSGTVYGEQKSFTTRDGIPTLTTDSITSITGESATSGGNITDDGGLNVTARGVCWSTSPNPTVSESHSIDGSSMGNFISSITGLTVNTTYYVRAYATTNAGTAYGNEMSFTTRDGIPTLVTTDITYIMGRSAISGGSITDDGGLDITVTGVCWSTSPNPTTSENYTTNGSGTDDFSSNIIGLEISTTYYVRAYATTSAGTAYGNEVSFTTLDQTWNNGISPATFSVSATQQVCFSQGNLQYQASTNTWRFTENQSDYIGSFNSNISSNYSGWIDLFGWGTSGYHNTSDYWNTNFQPWSSSYTQWEYNVNSFGYGPSTNMTGPNLTGSSANYDWGVYNPISNGGNTANQWRTLTQSEWHYVFNTRSTTSGIRYAKAQVNNVNGIILLPDDWDTVIFSLSNTNSIDASFSSNIISTTQWTALESAGAVFLPTAGLRHGTSVYNVGSSGYYWSASYKSGSYAYSVYFLDSNLYTDNYYSVRCEGCCVRLVHDSE